MRGWLVRKMAFVKSAGAVWAVPGSPYVNDEAAYAATTHARTTGQPFLGTCGGFQYAMVEYARNVAGCTGAGHAEDAGVEGIELRDHPFFVATLFQPQMAAAHDNAVHPLLRALIEAGS
jgi:CTP synthase (UTP-ammonia lyase)